MLDLSPPIRWADRLDACAARAIWVCGVMVILSVVAIVFFIGIEAVPLLLPAKVDAVGSFDPGPALVAGSDESRERVWVVRPDASIDVLDAAGGKVETLQCEGWDGAPLTAASSNLPSGFVALGSRDGRVGAIDVRFRVVLDAEGRHFFPRVSARGQVTLDGGPEIAGVTAQRDEDGVLRIAAVDTDGHLHIAIYDPEAEQGRELPLPEGVVSVAPETHLAISDKGPTLLVGSRQDIRVIDWTDAEAPTYRSRLAVQGEVSALALALGGETILVGTRSGDIEAWTQVARATEGVTWDRMATLAAPVSAPVIAIASSPRNKSFIAVAGNGALSLLHLTARRELARTQIDGHARSVLFAPKSDGAVVLADEGVRALSVWCPHPEVSLAVLFGKVWYESYPAAAYVWQTSGGSDEIEPKFSLVPLMLGTLKGTIYAMLFSAPLAIATALYLGQLAPGWLRDGVKPALELMAAIPSVIVGFIAALWFAPVLERNLLVMGLMGPCVLGAIALAHAVVAPILSARNKQLAPGRELLVVIPAIAAGVLVAKRLAPYVEARLFGGDLVQWLYGTAGVRYDQRNCLVVGVALGVAVIPIIFTIAEDAFSSVPPSLTSAALALGSTPWQTAVHVVLPAATPGVFAALMLGFGRALGETMIVLMATGNTPILDLLPFNGMRTMSAAIAVEIPEAPFGGTHYRVLFVVGLLLFIFSFAVNTVADLVSTRLRRRFGRL